MVQILNVVKSSRKGKKYTAILSDGKEVHFGSNVSRTYVEGASKQKRDNYMVRHLANPIERNRIKNNILSPALLSASLLWNTPSLERNIAILNNKLK
jgi:hypothetical protein